MEMWPRSTTIAFIQDKKPNGPGKFKLSFPLSLSLYFLFSVFPLQLLLFFQIAMQENDDQLV